MNDKDKNFSFVNFINSQHFINTNKIEYIQGAEDKLGQFLDQGI
jgi:hypothetical protein